MLDLAYQNGDGLNAGPLDMQVEYVKVWQGTGGSSTAAADGTTLSFPCATEGSVLVCQYYTTLFLFLMLVRSKAICQALM